MNALVLLMVDALRHDYVSPEATPFLHDHAAAGCQLSLVPPFGFEPDDAIFTGLSPAESDYGLQYWWDPDHSPFRFLSEKLGAAVDRLPPVGRLGCRFLTMALAKRMTPYRRVRDHPTTARIPFRYLHLFDFAQKHYPFEPAYRGRESLFKLAHRRQLGWLYYGFPKDEVLAHQVVAAAKRRITHTQRLLYFHVGDLDVVGHTHGPGSPELRAALRTVDSAIQALIDIVSRKLGRTQFLIFGDHGMCGVESHVDVRPHLAGLSVRPGRDFHYFVDSTLLRFWCHTAAAERQITEGFGAIPGVRLLGPSARKSLGIDYTHNRFGDLIYQLDEGYIAHPSFYADVVPPRGMHGYGPDARADRAALIASPGDVVSAAGIKGHCEEDGLVAMQRVYDLAVAALDQLD